MEHSEHGFNLIQVSAIHEIANIGLGHAMTALSEMTGHAFNMSVPSVDSVPTSTISELVGGPEMPCVGTTMAIAGDVTGFVAFVFDWSSACSLWRMLLGVAPASIEETSELEASAMLEVGNILNSSFLNAISELTGLAMHATPPSVGIEMASALTSQIILEAEMCESVALTLETSIFDADAETKGFFLFIPSREGIDQVFNRLGLGEAA